MDFHKRLQKAIERGHRAGSARARAEAEKAINEKDLARLYSQYRLEISERIEACLRQLADHLPGFRFETVVGERGWGAAISRDDIKVRGRPPDKPLQPPGNGHSSRPRSTTFSTWRPRLPYGTRNSSTAPTSNA